jgi:sugar/nucleoside kinase (ribokinase family)
VSDRPEIIGLGAVAVDDILYLDRFPEPDSKIVIRGSERRAGGLAGTALVAARRMGRTCAYAGTLGSDELSRFIVEGLAAEGVSVEHLVRRDPAPPFHARILVETSGNTRTILLDTRGVLGASVEGPPERLIRTAVALLVDQVGLEGMVRAAGIARAAGVPVVADFERVSGGLFPKLLALVDHLILPDGFAREISGAADAPSAVRALWAPGRAAVVVTRSGDGCWYMSAEEPGRLYHQPAFRVSEVDTNGCGDVFHGVYAAALGNGTSAAQRIRLASAVAALKATKAGGQKAIPDRAAAERFLAERVGEAPRSAAG